MEPEQVQAKMHGYVRQKAREIEDSLNEQSKPGDLPTPKYNREVRGIFKIRVYC